MAAPPTLDHEIEAARYSPRGSCRSISKEKSGYGTLTVPSPNILSAAATSFTATRSTA